MKKLLASFILVSASIGFPSLAQDPQSYNGGFWRDVYRDKNGTLYMQRIAFPNDGRGIAEAWIKEIKEDLEFKVQYDCEAGNYRRLGIYQESNNLSWGPWKLILNDISMKKLKVNACSKETTEIDDFIYQKIKQ